MLIHTMRQKQTRFLRALGLAAVLICRGNAEAQGRHPVSGRQIAGVMGAGGANWLVRPEREMEEEPDKALGLIGIEAGQTVADIGAGVGYFTLRMARLVGPAGRVYATDIQPEMLRLLRKRMERDGVDHIEPVLGTVEDPKLPAGRIDLALLVDVYHEFSEPQKMLAEIGRAHV